MSREKYIYIKEVEAENPAPNLGAWGERSQRRNRLLPL
jgi:hypothetical protein